MIGSRTVPQMILYIMRTERFVNELWCVYIYYSAKVAVS